MKTYTTLLTLLMVTLMSTILSVAQSQYVYFYPLNNNTNNNPFTANVDSYLNTTDATNGTPKGCYNADIFAQNNNGIWVTSSGNRSPKWTNSGSTFSLMLETDWNNASSASYMTVIFTFKNGASPVNVSGVTFNMYDINSAVCGTTTGIFIDSVSVRGYNTSNVYQNMTLSSVNPCITATGSGTSTTTFKGGASCGPNALSATVTFTSAISNLVITYASGRGYPADVTGPCAAPFPLTSTQDTRTQYIIISPINLGGCPPLPLQDFKFSVTSHKDKVLLQWNASDFDPQDSYYIERSTNGTDFTQIAQIYTQKGSTYDNDIYGYTHLSYRVVQKTKDGQEFYSNIEQVQVSNSNQYTYLFPNPTQNMINIYTNAYLNTSVQILDYTGRKIGEKFIDTPTTILDVSDWAKGLYFVQFAGGVTLRFIKQ
ncbi:MAG: T9SS type A sorting domain-containing protein [Bacteroidia bacterium]|nr:T9SS type A sorting domain-containing protein [Bacteroidia bacterium]MDW8345480.1 T9SS type A sorting domain-containing protein [Bacteroidia bacterium]